MTRASVRRSASWLPWARTQSHQESGPRESLLDAVHPELGTRFSLIEALGSGGMGIVYRAYDRELGHEVALKLLHVMSAQDRLRLKEEFRTLSELAHPNLVNLYELVVNERTCFFTMELVNGADFVAFARSAQQKSGEHFPEALRDAARQLALALHALHTNRKLHRDVKPSNVLVTDAGRVVLLDFGLVTRLSTSVDSQRSDGIAGTIHYMAPEQAWGKELTAAADWYGFGVTLFEALKGELPIAGAPYELALKKLDYKPSPLRMLGFKIPAELDQLLGDLLQPEPEARPKAERIMACLGEEITRLSFSPSPSVELPAFVGRGDELSQLTQAFDDVLAGATRIVEISGPSGIGKSTLVREFLHQAEAKHPTLVLTSRCHPREAVAFNAIDGLIDDLSRHLIKTPSQRGAELGAEQRAALIRVFPILGRCLVPAEERTAAADNPKHVRRLALAGLRELLGRVAAQRPVVLWIDDVHWGDEDSGFVLRELMRPPTLQGLLVILASRAEDRAASACLRVLADEERGVPVAAAVRRIELGPLGNDDGMRILREGVPENRSGATALHALLQESGGSPFFLSECVRYLRGVASDAALPSHVGLEELLRMRTQGLPEAAGAVLEVFCVAGAPLEQGVALRAAGLREADRGIITTLERVSILRTTDPQRRTLEVYHHRIRDDLLRRLPEERAAARHVAIASALLTMAQPNPLAAVDHFEAANDHAAVRRYIVAAANQASRVLAFDRAAKLYERAIELESSEMPPHELHRRLGLAFAHAGRGREAGRALLHAARLLDQTLEANPDHVVDLKQLASEQFLQTAHYEEGMAALRSVLSDLDIPFPSSRREALRKATALRLWSMVRGVRLPQGPRPTPSRDELRRFDALWATSHRLSMVDFTLTSYATVRSALDAVRLGEPSRMIRALAHEGCNSMAAPGDAFKKRGTHLIDLAASIVTDETSAGERSFLLAARGIAAWFLCDFQKAVELLDAAQELLRPTVRGVDWELALQGAWAMIGLAALGETRSLLERATLAREDAEQRDDRYMLQLLNLGPPALAWLVADRAREGIEQADRALSWAPSDYTTQHYEHYVSCVEADLYLGEGRNAWRRTLLTWPQHRSNHLLVLRFVGDLLWHARARAAVGAAESEPSRDSSETRAELRHAALQAATEMERHGILPALGWAAVARAAVAHQEGHAELAVSHLERALVTFDAAQLKLDRECARFRLGQLKGGDEGHAMTSEAERFMRAESILDPTAMARMVLPGFGA